MLHHFLLLLLASLAASQNNTNDVDDYIINLKYDPDQLLVFHGEPVQVLKKEGELRNKNFIVVTREVKDLQSGLADIGVIYNSIHRTYPGSVLLANSRLVDNTPDVLTVPRKSLRYTVDLPGMTNDGNFEIIPAYSTYRSQLNNVTNLWFEKYSKDYDVNAAISTQESLVYSRDQLKVQFGVDIKLFEDSFNLDFGALANRSQLAMLYKFKQIFYSVRVDSPVQPSDLFDDQVTRQLLIGKGVDEKSPLVLVDSVSYGRVIFLKLETSSTDEGAKLALKYGREELYHKLENLKITVYVMGGGAENHVELIKVESMSEAKTVIAKYARFDKTNPGFPVSYSTSFVKDNRRALVIGQTKYVETTREVYQAGAIQLEHYGWYVAQFYLSWDEINYDSDGNEVKTGRSWYKNGWDLTAGFNEIQQLDGNVRNIAVFAQECTGLFWEWWRKCIDVKNVPLIRYRKFKLSGSDNLNPIVEIYPPL